MFKAPKIKYFCKVCLQPVTNKNGLQCQGACKKWAHYTCLNYTPGKIRDIKNGLIVITCPCPTCNVRAEDKEYLVNPPYTCNKRQCPANEKPKCEMSGCPANVSRGVSPKPSQCRDEDDDDCSPTCYPPPDPCLPPPCKPSPCAPSSCAPSPCKPPPCAPSPCKPAPCPPDPCPVPCAPAPCPPSPRPSACFPCPPSPCMPPPPCPPPPCRPCSTCPPPCSPSPSHSMSLRQSLMDSGRPDTAGQDFADTPTRARLSSRRTPSQNNLRNKSSSLCPTRTASCSATCRGECGENKEENKTLSFKGGDCKLTCSDSLLMQGNSSKQHDKLMCTIHELCSTVGRLSTQIRELMCKMLSATNLNEN